MLRTLYIKNLAIIEEISIDFESGLNIITGETGAGKSLIIEAIQLLLGKKFTKELLRTGSDRLIIDGIFYHNKDEINIRRIYNSTGKSKAYINDHPIKQSELFDITKKLADIHGQHEHQALLDSNTHIHYLDAFAMHLVDIEAFTDLFNKMKNYQNNLISLKKEQESIKEKEELYSFQIKELTLYPISEKYEEEINSKYQLWANAEEMQNNLTTSDIMLNNENHGIISKVVELSRNLNKIAKNDSRVKDVYERICANIIDLEDISKVLYDMHGELIFAEDKMAEISEAVEHLELLKRKYGGTIKAANKHLKRISSLVGKFETNQEEIHILGSKLKKIKLKLNAQARNISKKRHEKSLELETSIAKHLKSLNMGNIKFKVKILSDMDKQYELGMDICEFFISTNRGEKIRPLSKTVSGGEVSRIMLAIKMALQSSDIISTLIFDEIDSGISGNVAEQVGNKIEELSSNYQILCISHLSQIAGKGKHHYKVWKKIKKDRHIVGIDKLSDQDRIKEIASLISGKKITSAGMKQAELLLENG